MLFVVFFTVCQISFDASKKIGKLVKFMIFEWKKTEIKATKIRQLPPKDMNSASCVGFTFIPFLT